MVQSKNKKISKNSKGKSPESNLLTPVNVETLSPTSKGGSFGKVITIAILLVLIWKGASYFSGQDFSKKFFVLKKIGEFTGTSINGYPMSAFGLTAIGNREIAVADAKNDHVYIINFDGKLIKKWGSPGQNGPLEFNEPSDVIMDSKNRLYVLDPWNGAIKIFDLNGKFIQALDLKKDSAFFGPRQMAYGGDFILIPSANSAVRLSLQGQVIDVIGRGPGSGKGEFKSASGPLVDSQGNLYVGDRGNKRVEEFDKDGKFLRAINVGGAPAELGMDSKGRLYVASDTDSSKVFSPTGEFLGNLSTESSPETTMAIRCMSITPDDVIVAGLEDQITLYQIVDK